MWKILEKKALFSLKNFREGNFILIKIYMFCMGTISLRVYLYTIYVSLYYILIYTVLYCTLLRNDYMCLYLLYFLLVYIHSLSFFLLVCSCALVIALYRHVLIVFMCCVSSHVVYAYNVLCIYVVFVFVVSRPSDCVRWRSVRPSLRACRLRSFRSLEGLRFPLPPCLRPLANRLPCWR